MNDQTRDYPDLDSAYSKKFGITTSPATESDPSGLDAHAPGAKLDSGKLRPELIQRGFARALRAVSEVGTFGANKYSDDGWQQVSDGQRRYTDALYRHLNAEHRGELRDPDSGFTHAAHAAWNALARLELALRELEAQHDAQTNMETFGPLDEKSMVWSEHAKKVRTAPTKSLEEPGTRPRPHPRRPLHGVTRHGCTSVFLRPPR